MALSAPVRMPTTQGGGLRWYSDLTGQWYTDLETATAEDSRAQALKSQTQTAQANQATNTANQTAAETTHLATTDELARQRQIIDQQQFGQELGLKQQTAGYQDPRLLAQLQADAEARRLAQLSSITSATSAAGGSMAPVTYGGSGLDPTAARDATYARAKDQIANQQRASLTALQNVAAQAGTNVAGGKNPALLAQEGQIINNAQGQLGDVTRQQTVQDLAAQQHAADKTYEGQIQQRGQNQNQMQSLMSLITARGLY